MAQPAPAQLCPSLRDVANTAAGGLWPKPSSWLDAACWTAMPGPLPGRLGSAFLPLRVQPEGEEALILWCLLSRFVHADNQCAGGQKRKSRFLHFFPKVGKD